MGKNSNKNKSEFLGMPHGTANGKLRKMILFHLLKKHSENVCARCSKTVESVDDLSIEHLKPWEGVSEHLFWDMDNIAFSHLHCNRPHRYNNGVTQRQVGPEGTAWCQGHNRFEPVENFWKDSTHWNGFCKRCKETQHYYRKFRTSRQAAS